MNGKSIACLGVLGTMALIGCTGSSSNIPSAAVAETKEVSATGLEQSLLVALNTERRKTGKVELTISPVLTRLARGESQSAASAEKLTGDTTAILRARSGFSSIGKLQGALKDRGIPTGKGFVDYWATSSRPMLLDDWSEVGVGVSKATDGRLFAVVVLGSFGGRGMSIMNPAMSPSGF